MIAVTGAAGFIGSNLARRLAAQGAELLLVDHPLTDPLNLYGKSKNDFDAWALAEVRDGRPAPPRWAGMKFFNVYGPREQHKHGMHSVVLQAFRQVLAEGEVRLFRSNDPAYADGGQLRDFVFVEDCLDHMLWLAGATDGPVRVGGLFNSGTGVARSFADLARAVFTALGREPTIRYIDMPASLSAQYQNYTQAEMTKLREAGYARPGTTLEDGVAQYVAWLQSRVS
jgi:ADP-L-glycero-D-manno-heptose 6-epimerase